MIKVKVDDTAFRRNVERFSRETKKEISDVLRQQARLLCVKLANLTLPIGLGGDTHAKAKKKIESDVRYMAQDLEYLIQRIDLESSEWGRSLKDALERGDRAALEAILKNSQWEGMRVESRVNKSLHQSVRGPKGRVRSGLLYSEKQLITGRGAVSRYVNQVVRKIGIAKGGWAGAAMNLGGARGIPGWVTRHRKFGSSQDMSKLPNNPHVVLANNVRYIKDAISRGGMEEAIRRQIRDFDAHLKYKTAKKRKTL